MVFSQISRAMATFLGSLPGVAARSVSAIRARALLRQAAAALPFRRGRASPGCGALAGPALDQAKNTASPDAVQPLSPSQRSGRWAPLAGQIRPETAAAAAWTARPGVAPGLGASLSADISPPLLPVPREVGLARPVSSMLFDCP